VPSSSSGKMEFWMSNILVFPGKAIKVARRRRWKTKRPYNPPGWKHIYRLILSLFCFFSQPEA
jgi:hypothetical protein